MKNYKTWQDLTEADQVKNNWYGYYVRMVDDSGIIDVQDGDRIAWYHPNGLVTLWPGTSSSTPPRWVACWPEDVQLQVFRGPYKEYVVILGTDGVTRHYVLPPVRTGGYRESVAQKLTRALTFMPHPEKLYVPAHPIPDYEIRVSRKQKNDGTVKWKDFVEFVDVMWDLLPANPDPNVRADVIEKCDTTTLLYDDRDTWHPYVQYMKMTGRHKDGLRIYVDRLVLEQDMPYNIWSVPDITTSHTDHWSWPLIKRLGLAGRLDDLPELQMKEKK